MDDPDGSKENIKTDTLYVAPEIEEESSPSELPTIEDWSSLELYLASEKKKVLLYNEGLYSPGSGEVCAKYVPMSNSSLLLHQFYNYPAVADPGIVKALLQPEAQVIYPDDGQELYLATCKTIDQCPVRMFHKGLLTNTINLRYYGVNSTGVQAMTKALERNRNVTVFDLTENFLNVDACFHLGAMLNENNTLEELILESCRVGPDGALCIFHGLLKNKTLRSLNLNRNAIGDRGIEFLAQKLMRGMTLKELHLSKNNLGRSALIALIEAFEVRIPFTHLDLSLNNLNTPALCKILDQLRENDKLQSLDLAWNTLSGDKLAIFLSNLFQAKNLTNLNLSNNQFCGDAIPLLVAGLRKAKKLKTLNLSYNPLTIENALSVINKIKLPAVKVKELFLDGVTVDNHFLEVVKQIKLKKKDVIITYGDVKTTFKPVGVDVREMLLKRIDYLLKSKKKKKVDFALVILQMLEDGIFVCDVKMVTDIVRQYGGSLEDSLMNALSDAFPGPPAKKKDVRQVNVELLGDFIKRIWPERKLPPKPKTPPPEPEPEPQPEPEKGKKKSRKK